MIDPELEATLHRAGVFLAEHSISSGRTHSYSFLVAEGLKNQRYTLFAIRHPESEEDLEELCAWLRDLLNGTAA